MKLDEAFTLTETEADKESKCFFSSVPGKCTYTCTYKKVTFQVMNDTILCYMASPHYHGLQSMSLIAMGCVKPYTCKILHIM